jgi:hypothetical protein
LTGTNDKSLALISKARPPKVSETTALVLHGSWNIIGDAGSGFAPGILLWIASASAEGRMARVVPSYFKRVLRLGDEGDEGLRLTCIEDGSS